MRSGILATTLLAIPGCDDEDPCVEQLERATRELVEAETEEELALASGQIHTSTLEIGTFRIAAVEQLRCAEFGSTTCSTDPSPMRQALEAQLECLEKR